MFLLYILSYKCTTVIVRLYPTHITLKHARKSIYSIVPSAATSGTQNQILENIINVSAISTLSVENQQNLINFPFFGKEYHLDQNEKAKTTESYLSSWIDRLQSLHPENMPFDNRRKILTRVSDAITVLSATFCPSPVLCWQSARLIFNQNSSNQISHKVASIHTQSNGSTAPGYWGNQLYANGKGWSLLDTFEFAS